MSYINQIGPNDLKEIDMKTARRLLKTRYNKTHPDSKTDSKLMFNRPNHAWKKWGAEGVDVWKFDGKNPPIFNELPLALRGRVVTYKGKVMIANSQGQWLQFKKGIKY